MPRLSAMLAVVLVVASCGGDSAVITTTSGASNTTETATDATTTSAPATTTTETASTTTAPATTTTEALDEPILFLPTGLGVVTFGMDPDDTVAAMALLLGPPTDDTGWVDSFANFGVCPGPNARRTSWGGLHLLFTDDGPFVGGGPQFFSYSYLGGEPGPTPGPPESVDAGNSVDQVLAIWPGAELNPGDEFFGASFRVDLGGGEQLYGRLTGITGTDTVTEIYGGYGCGE
jgi:hypothetical protein